VKPDRLIATAPDCDRMGIAAKEGDGYQLITGNEVGALLLEYICKSRVANGTMPKHPVSVKTIVTSTIIDAIGKEYGVEIIDVLTGFKYIGEQVGLLEAKGEEDRFIFGFEESYGYNAGSYVRDKDGVVASMLICEMAAYYKEKGMTVVDALRALYEKYDNYLSRQTSFYCEGASGMQRMADIMAGLRKDPPKEIGGFAVQEYADYQLSFKKDAKTGQERKVDLPKSNVLGYTLENGASVIVRPSGTEPKIKTYYTIVAPTMEEAEALHATIAAATNKLLGF
ncbi:phospho-sugar mutase, partial [Akkermansia muciniphila]